MQILKKIIFLQLFFCASSAQGMDHHETIIDLVAERPQTAHTTNPIVMHRDFFDKVAERQSFAYSRPVSAGMIVVSGMNTVADLCLAIQDSNTVAFFSAAGNAFITYALVKDLREGAIKATQLDIEIPELLAKLYALTENGTAIQAKRYEISLIAERFGGENGASEKLLKSTVLGGLNISKNALILATKDSAHTVQNMIARSTGFNYTMTTVSATLFAFATYRAWQAYNKLGQKKTELRALLTQRKTNDDYN